MQSQVENQVKQGVRRVSVNVDAPRTLAELFLKASVDFNRADALNYKKDGAWRSISSAEMISRSENIALGLYSMGLLKADRIALLAANSPEWTLVDAGCQFTGIIDVPIYTTLAPNSVEYIIKDSGAKIFFLDNRETFERVKEVLPKCATLEKLVFFDFAGIDAPNAISLAELEKTGAKLKTEKPHLIDELVNAVEPGDVATLIYTSGTTGEPKGVMLSHANLIANVINASAEFSFTSNDRPLSVLPLSHVFERSGMYGYILNGTAVYYAESIEKAADNLREVAPTIFVGVPRIFEKVYARAKVKAAQESQVKETIFDWAIEVAKGYALRTEKKQMIPRLLAVQHSIADRIVFSKLRDFFGGKLRVCITGGAALPDDIYLIFTGAGISLLQATV